MTIKRLSPILAALALAACADHPVAPPTPAPPPPARVLGLMEVTFESAGSGALTATARPVAAPPPRGPSLNLAPVTGGTAAPTGLQLRFGSRGFVDRGTTRYLHATFDVRNARADGTAYPQAQRNLTFVAVSTASTIAQTSLSSLGRFDGSSYTDVATRDEIARSILPTHGMMLSGGAMAVRNELADLQSFSEAAVAPLDDAALTPLAYGYVVRCVASCTDGRTLAASPAAGQFDGQVTFAVKLPIRPTAAENPFRFSMMFLVVEDSETRVTESVEEQGNGGVGARAAALPGSAVTLLGNSATSVPASGVDRLCRVRTAGEDPAAPLATLVDAAGCTAGTVSLPAHVRVVRPGAAGAGTGASWADAFPTLQDALACVRAGGGCAGVTELWLAAGRYYPDEGGGMSADNFLASFVLVNGLAIYGGFAGHEYQRGQRDWAAHRTILSGDLQQNDVDPDGDGVIDDGADIRGDDNSGVGLVSTVDHVARTEVALTSRTVLDGVTLTGGRSGSFALGPMGAAVNCGVSVELFSQLLACSLALENVQIVGNGTPDTGGSVVNFFSRQTSDVWMRNVRFRNNRAGTATGAAVLFLRLDNSAASRATLVSVRFEGSGGTDIHAHASLDGPRLTVVGAEFVGNRGSRDGPVRLHTGIEARFYNVVFRDNAAGTGSNSGGVTNGSLWDATVVNGTFTRNAGPASVLSGSFRVHNSVVWGNSAAGLGSGTAISHSVVQGGCPAGATCTGVLNADPLFVDAPGGDLRPAGGPAVDAGSTLLLPPDTYDLDGDGNTTEPLPLDVAGRTRVWNWTAGVAGGSVDMGAYEWQ